ncbi:MAG: nuclear transport factor 2 family protein [Candidatus Promineifilaceae bacterium]|nr:nuclear transport factor 2 family protein [Candidatus Promineifilaceae bacterium]
MTADEQAVWDTIHRHLESVFNGDAETYEATTGEELSLYEWFITPHRQDGLPFHRFMIEHGWAGAGADYRYDLWEPRLQLYGDTAIVSYTFMLSVAAPEGSDAGIRHRTHNESRVLVRREGGWQIVHVHKSPAWSAPLDPP